MAGAPRASHRLSSHFPVKFYNAKRGYMLARVDAQQWQTDFKIVDKVTEKGAALRIRASYVVETGEAEAKLV
jgi:alkaline phosphatase D